MIEKQKHRLLIRADSSRTIGGGHVARCLNLAQGWIKIGGSVTFVSINFFSALEQRAKDIGVEVVGISGSPGSVDDFEQTIKIAKNSQYVVLDGYSFGANYQRLIYSSGLTSLVIDDLPGKRNFFCDLILNQNLGFTPSDYIGLNSTRARLLLGPDYVLLPLDPGGGSRSGLNSTLCENVLVSLGGGDNADALNLILRSLNGYRDHKLNITVLAAGASINELSFRSSGDFHTIQIIDGFVNDLIARFSVADLAIVGGGVTTWEALAVGVPTAILCVAENQLRNSMSLDRLEAVSLLGVSGKVRSEEVSVALSSLINNPSKLLRLSINGKRVVSGRGVSRLVAEFLDIKRSNK
ncbi:MAG: UDP-2,4-diacetamido-2,4,6-trideoxy-beta-L-altropyranose hydrolase [Burkholderiales bacterium]|nr:UDP-2,4-diacetamido-2,4,6-trideoxy-beta-L-altropyranose hydrolase [Burkholderiales bacterium]